MTDTTISSPTDLITALKASLITAAFAPLNTALASIQANPSVPNVTAQVAAAEVNLAAILPGLQAVGISDIAQLAQVKLASLKANLLAPAPVSAAPAAAA